MRQPSSKSFANPNIHYPDPHQAALEKEQSERRCREARNRLVEDRLKRQLAEAQSANFKLEQRLKELQARCGDRGDESGEKEAPGPRTPLGCSTKQPSFRVVGRGQQHASRIPAAVLASCALSKSDRCSDERQQRWTKADACPGTQHSARPREELLAWQKGEPVDSPLDSQACQLPTPPSSSSPSRRWTADSCSAQSSPSGSPTAEDRDQPAQEMPLSITRFANGDVLQAMGGGECGCHE